MKWFFFKIFFSFITKNKFIPNVTINLNQYHQTIRFDYHRLREDLLFVCLFFLIFHYFIDLKVRKLIQKNKNRKEKILIKTMFSLGYFFNFIFNLFFIISFLIYSQTFYMAVSVQIYHYVCFRIFFLHVQVQLFKCYIMICGRYRTNVEF